MSLRPFALVAFFIFGTAASPVWSRSEAEWMDAFSRDPAQACRAPGTYERLRQQGRLNGAAVAQLCPSLTVYDQGFTPLTVHLDRVIGVDYVIAGRGEDFSSRWGHAMVRLRVCRAGESVGPKCVQDPYLALMSGYAAFSEEGAFNPLKGLAGKYPTIVTFELDALARVRYANDELRDVEYHPMHASRDQVQLLAALLVEHYWNTHGHYGFLTNNCASEIIRLFKQVFPNIARLQTAWERFEYPSHVVSLLEKSGLATAAETITSTSENSWIMRYLRESNAPARTLKEYLNTSAAIRSGWMRGALATDGGLQRWMKLESLALQSVVKKFEGQFVAMIRKKEHLKCAGVDPKFGELMAETYRTMTPRFAKSNLADEVPLLTELPSGPAMKVKISAFNARRREIVECLNATRSLGSLRQEMEQTKTNIKDLFDRQRRRL